MSEHEQELLQWAQRLSAKQEVSLFGMQQRLSQRGATPSECENVIAVLQADGFIDELRFARAYVHDKFRFEKWGRMKIAYKLSTHHRVKESIITEALGQLHEEEELTLLEALLRHKLKGAVSVTHEEREKLFRFAEQRGFTKAQTFAVLKRVTAA